MKVQIVSCLALAAALAHAQAPEGEPVIYPNMGQTAERQAADREACAQQALREIAANAPSADAASARRTLTEADARDEAEVLKARFARAWTECLQDRGYVVGR